MTNTTQTIGEQLMTTAAPTETRDTRARADAPGALRSQATMEIQTRQAQRLVYGRMVSEGKHEIVGLLRFAAMLRPIWSGSMADDPYADWWLVKVERELTQARDQLKHMENTVAQHLTDAPAVNVVVAQSLSPARLELNFSNPYAFHGAYLLADYDALVRAVLTARHVGLMDSRTSEKLLAEGGRYLRAAYETARGYRYMGIKRVDLVQGTAKARKAVETLGELPQPVISGELRATYAPKVHSADRSDVDTDVNDTDDESRAPTDGVEEEC
jgi:integrating conjugative element protein (TIGR03761 family)